MTGDDAEDDYEPDDGDDCYFCGGEGFDECHDPLECCQEHTADGLCPCLSCGGTGLAKDMTIW